MPPRQGQPSALTASANLWTGRPPICAAWSRSPWGCCRPPWSSASPWAGGARAGRGSYCPRRPRSSSWPSASRPWLGVTLSCTSPMAAQVWFMRCLDPSGRPANRDQLSVGGNRGLGRARPAVLAGALVEPRARSQSSGRWSPHCRPRRWGWACPDIRLKHASIDTCPIESHYF